MRRRRQRNPLLMRIVGVSILAHIIALPILAHFGAFKKIQREFIETRLVTLPPPPQEKEKPEVKKQRAVQKPPPTAKKSASTTSHARQAAQKSNLNQPKVVASAGSGNGAEGEPTVDANGMGKAGVVPTEKTNTKPPTVQETPPLPKEETPKKPEPPVQTAHNDTPPVKPIEKQPEIKAPEVKKEPVLTEAVPTHSPQPTIPDDLRSEALDKTFVAEFVVGPDGTPTEIKVSQSTGNDELDKIALDTAKQWRFKPATRDGAPVESRIRLHIEFQVS